MNAPLLKVENIAKRYARGILRPKVTFSLAADFELASPGVVGVLGPNGSGKTTLFELMTGSNLPTAGRVLVNGQDIHRVRTRERDRLAIHSVARQHEPGIEYPAIRRSFGRQARSAARPSSWCATPEPFTCALATPYIPCSISHQHGSSLARPRIPKW